jgi:hypothetical protein
LGIKVKNFAQHLVATVFASVVIGGCAFTNDAEPAAQNVRSLTFVSARSCRLIGDVSTESPDSLSGDQLNSAMVLARAAVAKAGGNALLVKSMSVKTRAEPNRPSRYLIHGQAYSCA